MRAHQAGAECQLDMPCAMTLVSDCACGPGWGATCRRQPGMRGRKCGMCSIGVDRVLTGRRDDLAADTLIRAAIALTRCAKDGIRRLTCWLAKNAMETS